MNEYNVILDNGSKYIIKARDEKEAYEIATNKEIESLKLWFKHHQKHGTYNATLRLNSPERPI